MIWRKRGLNQQNLKKIVTYYILLEHNSFRVFYIYNIYTVFSSGDIKYFINYHLTHNPMSFEQLVKSTRYKEKIAK